eukprot:Rmarinus@m.1461
MYVGPWQELALARVIHGVTESRITNVEKPAEPDRPRKLPPFDPSRYRVGIERSRLGGARGSTSSLHRPSSGMSRQSRQALSEGAKDSKDSAILEKLVRAVGPREASRLLLLGTVHEDAPPVHKPKKKRKPSVDLGKVRDERIASLRRLYGFTKTNGTDSPCAAWEGSPRTLPFLPEGSQTNPSQSVKDTSGLVRPQATVRAGVTGTSMVVENKNFIVEDTSPTSAHSAAMLGHVRNTSPVRVRDDDVGRGETSYQGNARHRTIASSRLVPPPATGHTGGVASLGKLPSLSTQSMNLMAPTLPELESHPHEASPKRHGLSIGLQSEVCVSSVGRIEREELGSPLASRRPDGVRLDFASGGQLRLPQLKNPSSTSLSSSKENTRLSQNTNHDTQSGVSLSSHESHSRRSGPSSNGPPGSGRRSTSPQPVSSTLDHPHSFPKGSSRRIPADVVGDYGSQSRPRQLNSPTQQTATQNPRHETQSLMTPRTALRALSDSSHLNFADEPRNTWSAADGTLVHDLWDGSTRESPYRRGGEAVSEITSKHSPKPHPPEVSRTSNFASSSHHHFHQQHQKPQGHSHSHANARHSTQQHTTQSPQNPAKAALSLDEEIDDLVLWAAQLDPSKLEDDPFDLPPPQPQYGDF